MSVFFAFTWSLKLDTDQLNNGVQYIRNIVGDQFSQEDMVEAIRQYSMDAVAALNRLLERGQFLTSLKLAAHAHGVF